MSYILRLSIVLASLVLVFGNILQDFDFVIQKSRSALNVANIRSKRTVLSNEEISVESFHVTSKITSRYGRTVVESVLRNPGFSAGEATVVVRLPKRAFITNFTMEIDDIVYVGIVKEKAVAKRQYQAAVSRGETAGLVTAKVREVQTFDVAVNVEAGGDVAVTLNYEELLTRKLGEYNNVIYADPGQVVDDYRIEVTVTEPSKIIKFNAVPPLPERKLVKNRGAFDALLDHSNIDIRQTKTQAYVRYEPTIMQQKALLKGERTFTVTYDVTRENLGGEILVKDGYFVHFFAPDSLPVIPKNIVFVIDVSGSMAGRKIAQTKTALTTILSDLKESDRFNLVTFSSKSHTWMRNEMVSVNEDNIDNAKNFVHYMNARGGTNLNQGMLDGISLLRNQQNNTNSFERASMVILLTDGQPTNGVTRLSQIKSNIQEAVGKKYSIFCLGFGPNVDHKFLSDIANHNQGLSRRIYDDSDAALQLKGFYDEVASPMLAHVIMKYSGEEISKVTETKFDNFFDGSEIVVVGKINQMRNSRSPAPLMVSVAGDSLNGGVNFVAEGQELDTSNDELFDMEKLWAYMTIRELLKKKDKTSDKAAIREIDQDIVTLSLKFNFVTPLTSMVVTRPNNLLEVLGEPVPITPRHEEGIRMYSLLGVRARSGHGRLGNQYLAQFTPSSSLSYFLPSLPLSKSRLPSLTQSQSPLPQKPRKHRHFTSRRRRTTTTAMTTTQARTTTTTTQPPSTTTPPPSTTTLPTTTPPSTIRVITTPQFVAPPANPWTLPEITCGRNITLIGSAHITTPNYPDLYSANLNCVWKITSGGRIKITFQNIDMEGGSTCSRDRILVFKDQVDNEQEPPTAICGYHSSPTVINALGTTLILFQSDEIVHGQGFEAVIDELDGPL